MEHSLSRAGQDTPGECRNGRTLLGGQVWVSDAAGFAAALRAGLRRLGLGALAGLGALLLALALAPGGPAAPPAAQAGPEDCPGCTKVVEDNDDGCKEYWDCEGLADLTCPPRPPGWKLCQPGARRTTVECREPAGVGVICELECAPDGMSWKTLQCSTTRNDVSTNVTYCDYTSGDCPSGQGKPTRVVTLCANGNYEQTVERGACGAGGCVKNTYVRCKPGRVCTECRPGDTRPECDYCVPGSTRDCNGQPQECPPSGVFPPCAECTPGEQKTCDDGSVVNCLPDGRFPPCAECTPGEEITCDNGRVVTCTPDGQRPPCGDCIPGQRSECPNGAPRICTDDGTWPPCTVCIPGQRVYCPCDGEWKECTEEGYFEQCGGSCAPGQVVYCPNGEHRVCNEQCQVAPCAECTPDTCGPTPCAPDGCCIGAPECVERPGYWVCEWNGNEVVRIPTPCPEVTREPWPRALVGVPVELRITDSCQPATASNSVPVDPPFCDRSFYVIGYRGTLTFQCASAQLTDARWQMDERSWNIGKVSDNVMTPYVGDGRPGNNPALQGRMTDDIMRETEGDSVIRNTRNGRVVRHIYETPSYDKPVNGPGSPDISRREPAYQVSLTTNWELIGTFQYQRLITYIRCYDSGGNEKPCDMCFDPRNGNPLDCNKCYNSDFVEGDCEWPGYSHPPGPAYSRTFTETPWFAGPVVRIPVEVQGALVRDDPQRRNICGPIPIPVQQIQTIIRPRP